MGSTRYEDVDSRKRVDTVFLVVRLAVEFEALHARGQVVATELKLDRFRMVLRFDLVHPREPITYRRTAVGVVHVRDVVASMEEFVVVRLGFPGQRVSEEGDLRRG